MELGGPRLYTDAANHLRQVACAGAIWGLLFLVVLTMIAAARETMTPGSWRKKGLLYELPSSQSPATPPAKPTEEEKP